MKFAITTKSGRSIIVEKKNYKDAQMYADSHFGKGAIVELVRNSIVSTNHVVNMALNLADRRRPGVDDSTVKLVCDTYDRGFNIKASAIKETCHLHDTFLREWLGHIGLGAETDSIIKKIEKDGRYEGSFTMKHTFVIKS